VSGPNFVRGQVTSLLESFGIELSAGGLVLMTDSQERRSLR
jgi:hypothetical protein